MPTQEETMSVYTEPMLWPSTTAQCTLGGGGGVTGLAGGGMMAMDYSQQPAYGVHSSPGLSFTSPPATPMTPCGLPPPPPPPPQHSFHCAHAQQVPYGPAQMIDPLSAIHCQPLPPLDHRTLAPCFPPLPPSLPPPLPVELRLHALCQHLHTCSQIVDADKMLWWDQFLNEYFHEQVTFCIKVDLGDGLKEYRLIREGVGWYFRSMLKNGVTAVGVRLGQCRRNFTQNNTQQVECRNAEFETDHSIPHLTKVCASGTMIIDFTIEERARIHSWFFHIEDHTEFIPRNSIPSTNEDQQLTSNITTKGILPVLQKFLMAAGNIDSENSNSGLHLPHSIDGHPISPSTPGAPSGKRPKGRRGSPSTAHNERKYILVASEATPLTEEILASQEVIEERTITRVSNNTKDMPDLSLWSTSADCNGHR